MHSGRGRRGSPLNYSGCDTPTFAPARKRLSPILRRLAHWQSPFQTQDAVLKLEHPFLPFQPLSLAEVLKRVGDLVEGALHFVHLLAQLLHFFAQLDDVAANEQSALEEFKELLPYG